jgi:hypothetical protein
VHIRLAMTRDQNWKACVVARTFNVAIMKYLFLASVKNPVDKPLTSFLGGSLHNSTIIGPD